MAMQDARDDMAVQKTAKKTSQQEMYREKEMVSQALMTISLNRRTADDTSEESIEEVPASSKNVG